MFEQWDENGLTYLGVQLEGLYRDVERTRKQVVRWAQGIADEASDPERAHWVSRRNPDPIEEYEKAQAALKTATTIYHTFCWAIGGADAQDEAKAWLARIEEQAKAKTERFG